MKNCPGQRTIKVPGSKLSSLPGRQEEHQPLNLQSSQPALTPPFPHPSPEPGDSALCMCFPHFVITTISPNRDSAQQLQPHFLSVQSRTELIFKFTILVLYLLLLKNSNGSLLPIQLTTNQSTRYSRLYLTYPCTRDGKLISSHEALLRSVEKVWAVIDECCLTWVEDQEQDTGARSLPNCLASLHTSCNPRAILRPGHAPLSSPPTCGAG